MTLSRPPFPYSLPSAPSSFSPSSPPQLHLPPNPPMVFVFAEFSLWSMFGLKFERLLIRAQSQSLFIASEKILLLFLGRGCVAKIAIPCIVRPVRSFLSAPDHSKNS